MITWINVTLSIDPSKLFSFQVTLSSPGLNGMISFALSFLAGMSVKSPYRSMISLGKESFFSGKDEGEIEFSEPLENSKSFCYRPSQGIYTKHIQLEATSMAYKDSIEFVRLSVYGYGHDIDYYSILPPVSLECVLEEYVCTLECGEDDCGLSDGCGGTCPCKPCPVCEECEECSCKPKSQFNFNFKGMIPSNI